MFFSVTQFYLNFIQYIDMATVSLVFMLVYAQGWGLKLDCLPTVWKVLRAIGVSILDLQFYDITCTCWSGITYELLHDKTK